ncbi:MAG: acyclic terpene utilization AtuA family protein [Pirellulales bacterium]|nr:acyclic terpene utilization AtuA family protein [Pirellulales bacterium]
MRFARLHCEGEGVPVGLEELAAGGELDFLQLDYPRPRTVAIEGAAAAELPGCALGFTQATRSLVKTLFLEPELRVVTSAGWSDAYRTVEHTAVVLVEGGCGELPVSAVRGSNLLPILEMLVADRVDLSNARTGAPWKELREPILAADLQLGAGPMVTALNEHARVIVAGHFDEAAPAMAAAVAKFGWRWDDFDRLAAAAAAARAAAWCDWQPSGEGPLGAPWTPPRVELDEAGRCVVNDSHGGEEAANRLQQWMRTGAASESEHVHVDVRLNPAGINCLTGGPRQIAVDGACGAESDGCWRLEVLYQAGYAAEAMIEFSASADAAMRRHLAEVARAHLHPMEDAGDLLTVEQLQPLGDRGIGWLHLAFQSKSRKACQYFVDQTLRLTAAHRPLTRLASGPPRVHVHCGLWPARVPRGAVDIAVETRLAREWV